MNVLLWVLQVLLAMAFFAHGWLLLAPPAEMLQQMARTLAEVLAAIGLTLPGITRIQPRLIPWAAAGLMIVMVGATVLHSTRGETSSAITTALLFVLLTCVAYLRWKVRPIAPRVDRFSQDLLG